MNDKTNEAQRSRASSTNDKTNAAKLILRTLFRQRHVWASSTSRKQTIIAGVIAIATLGAVAVATWYFLASKPETPMATASSENQGRKVLYWTDPMVPGFKSDKPGKSPFMDMEMVPVYADDADTTTVSVRPEIIQSLGVRTHTVVRSNRGITIPSEALIRTGTRNAVVLAIGAGRFQPVYVTPGAELDDWVEIRNGIKAGDVVVTSGQFLIDSEANIRASFARMQPGEPGVPTGPKAATPVPAGASPHAGH